MGRAIQDSGLQESGGTLLRMSVRTVIERGPKEKKVAAVALDWPGWSRGARTADAALELLAAYRQRYRPIARDAGLGGEFESAGELGIVEDHFGPGSTDFWGISFAPASYERELMSRDELERKLSLLEAAWRYFDEVAARVSPEMRKGPRGGGRDRDVIIRHVLVNEGEDFSRRIGAHTPREVILTAEGLRAHRAAYLAALRERNEHEWKVGRNWTLPFLLRHTAYHVLDHAWEMEDKDLS
jgi:hypothetical protein